jgi:hypothetical protein
MAATNKKAEANAAGRDREFWKNARLGKEHDRRRCGLSDDDREEIKKLYVEGVPQREIARQYDDKCSRRTIGFILFPERRKAVSEANKERRKDGRYYDKETHTKAVAKWRDKIKELQIESKLK